MRILVVEDDSETREYLNRGLSEAGHVVDTADNGNSGVSLACDPKYDVMVIDRMLPECDGLAVVQAVRDAGLSTPVLILSALGEVNDRVTGLRQGGDDYLVKPFAFSELVARLDALVRRADIESTATLLVVSDLEMDLLAREVTRAGQHIELQPREFRLLEYLMRHQGHVVKRTMLLEQVWDYNFDPQTNVIDVHVSRLRRKIDRGFDAPLIQTVRGAGYVLRASEEITS